MFKRFEWDPIKDAENLRKHGIGFQEAIGIFADPDYVEEIDDRFVYGEERCNAIGRIEDKLFIVSYTESAGICRMISARLATLGERKRYVDRQV